MEQLKTDGLLSSTPPASTETDHVQDPIANIKVQKEEDSPNTTALDL